MAYAAEGVEKPVPVRRSRRSVASRRRTAATRSGAPPSAWNAVVVLSAVKGGAATSSRVSWENVPLPGSNQPHTTLLAVSMARVTTPSSSEAASNDTTESSPPMVPVCAGRAAVQKRAAPGWFGLPKASTTTPPSTLTW
jgi:hypothetical protein